MTDRPVLDGGPATSARSYSFGQLAVGPRGVVADQRSEAQRTSAPTRGGSNVASSTPLSVYVYQACQFAIAPSTSDRLAQAALQAEYAARLCGDLLGSIGDRLATAMHRAGTRPSG